MCMKVQLVVRRRGLCVLQADSNGNVLDGPETVSNGLADLPARDREL